MTQETKILLGIGIATVVLVVGGAIFFGGKSTTDNSSNSGAAKVDPKILVRKDSNIFGPANAKVTFVEFGDFQCPACGSAYPVTKQILQTFNGKIRFVFRNYPLPQHQNAQIGAEAAEAAGVQGKYWQMHDMLYERQSEWGESSKPLDYFMQYAKNIGINTDTFKQDVQNNKFQNKIQADINDGNSANVNATPTFFINGEQFTDATTYDNFKSAINAKL